MKLRSIPFVRICRVGALDSAAIGVEDIVAHAIGARERVFAGRVAPVDDKLQ